VIPFLDERLVEDLRKVVFSEDQLEAEAGILAVYQSNYPPAKQLLQACSEEVMAIGYEEITWEKIGAIYQENRA
jgi:hypothetical protein